jgi:hypothetical protein
MNALYRFLYIVTAGTIILLTSCKKDHDMMVAKPVIASQSLPDSTTTTGDTLMLHPAIADITTGTTFSWTVNGQQAGTDSVFLFSPTTRGDYQLVYTATNAGGSTSVTYKIHVYGKYENGFFITNEGWYGTGAGILNFFRYDTQQLEDSVFNKVNPGKDLGPIYSTLEFGTIYNNKLYLLAKYGGPLVAVDAFSLKETGRIASDPGNDFRALLPLDTTRALVSTGFGVFPLNLQTMTLGAAIPAISGEADDMVKAGNYIFVLDGNGLDVLNASDYSIAKNFSNISVGFAVTTDGTVWAAGSVIDPNTGIALDSNLVKINPSTLDTTNIHLPFDVNGTFGLWHPGSIVASTKENAVFLAYNIPYEDGTTIYKYVAGNPASLAVPYITLPLDHELYGAGIGYDASRNQLVTTVVQSGFGNNSAFNDLDFYDGTARTGLRDIPYKGYFFPSQIIFH